jgi:hypothetical protein
MSYRQELSETLSDSDIKSLLKGKCNVIKYGDLWNYDTIEEAMGSNGCLVILYETSKNFGHWCCVFFSKDSKGKKIISFQDSYGYIPDQEFSFINPQIRAMTGQNFPYLTYLLFKTPYQIEYNEYQLQSKKNDISTCGRWAVARILLSYLTVDQFKMLFTPRSGMSSDQLVCAFIDKLRM